MADESAGALARAVTNMARDILDHDEEINALLDRTDLTDLNLEDLRDAVGLYTGIVRLLRIELRHVATVALEVSREVGVWPDEADALAEYLEHIIERDH